MTKRYRLERMILIAVIALSICHDAHADDGALTLMDALGALSVVLLILVIAFARHVIKRSTREGRLAARYGWQYGGLGRFQGGDVRRYVNGERDQFEWHGGYSEGSSDDAASFVGVDFEALIGVNDAVRLSSAGVDDATSKPLCLLIESRSAFDLRMKARENPSHMNALAEKTAAWIERSPTAKIAVIAGLVAVNATGSGQDASTLWSVSAHPYDPYTDPAMKPVECGSAHFDNAFMVLATDASATRLLLSSSLAHACHECARAFDAPLRITLRAGRVRIELANARFTKSNPAEHFFVFGRNFAGACSERAHKT